MSFAQRYFAATETRRNRVLFNGRGAALDPVATLWRYSLKPLMAQYLSGVDAVERDALLQRAEAVLLTGVGS